MPFLTMAKRRVWSKEAKIPSVRFRYKPFSNGPSTHTIVIEDPPKEVRIRYKHWVNHLDAYDSVERSFLIRKPWSYYIALIDGYFTLRSSIIFFSEERLKGDTSEGLLYAPLPNLRYTPLYYWKQPEICMGKKEGTRGFGYESHAVRMHDFFWSEKFTSDLPASRCAVPQWMSGAASRRGWLSKLREWERRTREGKPLTWREVPKSLSSVKRAVRWFYEL